MTITDISLLDFNKTYTYADYLCWQVKERLELIKGRLFKMSPAPATYHQKISGHIYRDISYYLKKRKCEVFHAPFDVRLPIRNNENTDEAIFTIVQPDICIICDSSIIDARGCLGAPDMIVEILSPSTAAKDLKDKFYLYEETGVKEYWVVYPGENILEIFIANEHQKYVSKGKYTREDTVEVCVIDGLKIDLQEIFDEANQDSNNNHLYTRL